MPEEHPYQPPEPAVPAVAPGGDPHPVTDLYVARRLAEGATARAEQSRQEQENLVGETPASGSFLFYLLLGLLISLLLIVVIFRTSERSPAPNAASPALTAPG